MTQIDHHKGYDLSPDAKQASRPRIWVEGRQRPRFNLGAHARVSLALAKRDLAPEIVDAADRLSRFGDRLRRGEVRANVAWAGRAGQFLPSAARVATGVLGLSALFRTAHDLLNPVEPADTPIAYPNLIQRSAEPAPRVVLRVVEPTRIEPTLHAIRSAIQSNPHDFAHEGAQVPPPADPVPANPVIHRFRAAILTAAGWLLLIILMAFALPMGAVRALLFHFEGGDLTDWS